MAFQIDVPASLRSIEKVQKQLAKIPPAVIPACEMAVANYLLNVLIKQEIPPYKRVTRRSVYGKPFKTVKQRKWFFWALQHGVIDVPYRRRGRHGGIATQWHILQPKEGVLLRNDDPGAQYVYGDTTQNKLIARIGWKTIGTIVRERTKQLGGVLKRAADTALRKAIPKP